MDDTRGVTFSGVGRRAFLRRAAVVGAIAWTAPVAPVDAADAALPTPAPEPDAEVRTLA